LILYREVLRIDLPWMRKIGRPLDTLAQMPPRPSRLGSGALNRWTVQLL